MTEEQVEILSSVIIKEQLPTKQVIHEREHNKDKNMQETVIDFCNLIKM